MGRQINFFMMPEDVAELDVKIKELGLVIVADRMATQEVILYNSLLNDFGKDKFLVLPEEIPLLSLHFVEVNNYYIIHPLLSPVVEYSQPKINSEQYKLIEGRLYYNTHFLTDAKKFQSHSDRFILTTENLFSWYRSKYKKNKVKGYYVCENAKKWSINNNGILAINMGLTQLTF